MMVRSKRIAVLMLLVFGLMASVLPVQAQSGGRSGDMLQMFPPSGAYAVGRTTLVWTDASRPEVHTEDPDDLRELPVEVWYPAEPDEDAEFAAYMPEPLAVFFEEVNNLGTGRMQAVRANAVLDAPLASDQDSYPVLIFDPGFSASAFQYSVILEELASQGYVVFAMSHPYVTAMSIYPDGRAVEAMGGDHLRTLWVPQDVYDGEFYGAWVPDTSFVVEQMIALNADDPVGRFTGRLDVETYGMVGHSQGARTISEVCYRDPRCAAAVNLDGSYSAEVDLGFDRPYMFILADNGVEDFITTFQSGFEALGAGYYVLMIPKTQHMSFADTAFWVVLTLDEVPEGTGAGQIALVDYRLYITAFFDKHLRGLDVPLLDGASDQHPEVFFLDRREPIIPATAGADPQPAVTGGNLGSIVVGAADVWTYDGAAGEVLNLLLMADRPADGADEEQRAQYNLLDTMLVVRDPSGSVLAANDDMLTGMTNSELRGLILPEDGTYRIEVRSWASKTGGGYTLILESDTE